MREWERPQASEDEAALRGEKETQGSPSERSAHKVREYHEEIEKINAVYAIA
jgi:hypothetical protein